MDIKKILKELSLPDPLIMNDGTRVNDRDSFMKRREEIKELLSHEIYGNLPERPDHLEVRIIETDKSFTAGKAYLYTLEFTVTFGDTVNTFKVKSAVPNGPKRSPAIIYLSDSDAIPNKYLPAEEILDRGYALFVLPFDEITAYGKGSRYKGKLAKQLSLNLHNYRSPGKLMMWAWGAMRVLDYVVRQEYIDADNVAVAGFGMLGISALIASGYDERFKYAIANCAGTLGTALSRHKCGDTPENIIEEHPELFCKRLINTFTPFCKRSYDQHFLLFLSLDRHLLIGSAESDRRGDPISEFLAVASLTDSIKLLCKNTEPENPDMPRVGESVTVGRVSYHLHSGVEYFTRDDWKSHLDYIDKNLKNQPNM